jgi:hypothetical protein
MDETRNDRENSGRRTFLRLLLLVIAIPPVILTLSLFGLFPWSGLNSWRYDIDINSGRIRYTRHFFWIEVTSSIRDSILTKALSPEDLSGRLLDWHPVTTLSPGQHYSPHHRFHGAIFQIRELESCWETGKMTPTARRVMARQVLQLWQENLSDHRAGDYIQAVWAKAGEAEKRGKVMDVDDVHKVVRNLLEDEIDLICRIGPLAFWKSDGFDPYDVRRLDLSLRS